MDVKSISSDRGRQIAHRSKTPNQRHVSDVRGAVGCYYCWLGEYGKCQEHCQLVHDGGAGGGAASTTFEGLGKGRHPVVSGRFAPAPGYDPFSLAVRSCSRAVEQRLSIFDLDPMQQSTSNAAVRATLRSSSVAPTNLANPTTHGGSVDESGRQLVVAGDAAWATSSRSPSAASRRGGGRRVYSLHRPVQPVTAYKHPHGSEMVRATEYTTVAITPASHCYDSRRQMFVPRGDSIWDGALVKGGGLRTPSGQTDSRIDGADGDGGDRWRPSAARLLHNATSSQPLHQSRNDRSRQGKEPASLVNPQMRVEEQLSSILSGRFDDAFSMPLPGLFQRC